MKPRALLWARSGLIWLLLTMVAGLHIGIAGEFGASSHHAHAGLLGGLWAIAFAWLFDRKGLPLTGAAKVQWALYNLGVVTMAVALFLVVRQSGAWGPVIGLSGLVVLASTIWMVINAWPRATSPD
jgi:hypothetical protein